MRKKGFTVKENHRYNASVLIIRRQDFEKMISSVVRWTMYI